MTAPVRLFDTVGVGDVLEPLSYEVTATTVVLGALASRDWRPMHHDRDFAQIRNGTKDIFVNTPNLAAWFERYLTDWSGPHGRLGSVTFKMRGSIFPGDTMVFSGSVINTAIDASGCGFVTLEVTVTVDGDVKTTCTARIALPTTATDNPWARSGETWQPREENHRA